MAYSSKYDIFPFATFEKLLMEKLESEGVIAKRYMTLSDKGPQAILKLLFNGKVISVMNDKHILVDSSWGDKMLELVTDIEKLLSQLSRLDVELHITIISSAELE